MNGPNTGGAPEAEGGLWCSVHSCQGLVGMIIIIVIIAMSLFQGMISVGNCTHGCALFLYVAVVTSDTS